MAVITAPSGSLPRVASASRPKTNDWLVLQAILVVADALVLCAALASAYNIRLVGPWGIIEPANAHTYQQSAVLIVPIWLLVLGLRGLYRRAVLLGGPREYNEVFGAAVYSVVVTAMLGFLWTDWPVSRVWLGLSSLCGFVFLEIGRFGVRRLGYALRRRGWYMRDVLIVGANRDGRAIAEQLNAPSYTGARVLGFLDDYLPVGTHVTGGLQVLGRPVSAVGHVYCPPDCELVVVPQAVSWETLQTLVRKGVGNELKGRIKLAAGFYELIASGVEIEQCARVPLLTLSRVNVTGAYGFAKSAVDILGAVLLLLASLPVLLIFWLGATLRGVHPLFEKHAMMGRLGREFTLMLFRVDAVSERGGPVLRWLASHRGVRRLPALFSVLRRDMSLVGPEPHSLEEAGDVVASSLPNLLTVRPGLWSLHVGIESLQERISQDLYYVRNFSLGLDMQIIVRRVADSLRSPRIMPAGAPADAPIETSSA